MKTMLLGVLLLILPMNSYSYVRCIGAVHQIGTASGPGFHNFIDVGAVGQTLFTWFNASDCWDSEGGKIDTPVWLLIDDINNAGTMKKLWINELYIAYTTHKSIQMHSGPLQQTSIGWNVSKPYFIELE